MPKRKIRHALVQYTVKEGGNTRYETAFRNQVVDIPGNQVERLDELGATVEPDADLARPGRMLALPETAGDAEILNWVMGASNDEVEALVSERPAMASRIEAAHAAVKKRFEEQDLHLGGLREIAEEAEADAEAKAKAEAEAAEAEAKAKAEAEENGGGDDDLIGDTLSPEQADEVVKGKAPEVADYIAENPRSAGVILEAEGRRAAAAKDDVRVTITRAAEAAAGFTQ